ncbi:MULTISPECIES: hypothetical protein [Raineya]|jgi:hypothetical protein|uniref:Uncharacterized protein n=1 Tax=Raineya orbicola TaxID=2016530 RepID=A0A2N3I7Z9_9BACT|nr:hypothetical protein [Raineya orbicola]PKQ66427.1 hypothetical protein Rain11_2378 [Raineya orbicola]
MQNNSIHTESFPNATGIINVPAGFLLGSIYNKSSNDILVVLGSSSINIAPNTIYNFEYIGKTYPEISIIAGVNVIDAVFHY